MNRHLHGEEHPEVAESFIDLFRNYRFRGEYEEAKANLLEAHRIHKILFGEKSVEVGNHLGSLGCLLGDMGEYDKAESAYLESIQIYNEATGTPENKFAIQTWEGLAILYRAKGEVEKAEAADLEAIRIEKVIHAADLAPLEGDVASLTLT